MNSKMPWIDREKCDISEACEGCSAVDTCRHGAFVVFGGNGSGEACRVGIDFEKCRLCGDCSHACDRGAVKMV
jgi:NAD-dependent dihydropyrimidine dehydrogenase PreA subunit